MPALAARSDNPSTNLRAPDTFSAITMTEGSNIVLFTNGRIFNGSSSVSAFHSSLVVEDGKISYVGSSDSEQFQEYQSKSVRVQDVKNQYILPGFIDAHCHFLLLGQSLHKVDLDGCRSLSDIRSCIKSYAEANPDKPRILCRGWMHSMTDGEAKATMLDDLDSRPIYIDAKDLHSTWCNSAALKEMGVHEMADPAGGTIERDEAGNASGLLSEACVILIVWPYLSTVSPMEEKLAALKAAISAYHEAGITGCIDMAMDENAWEALLALRDAEGTLPIHVAAHWVILPGDGEASRLQQVDRAIELSEKFSRGTSPDLRIVGIKVICDGVIDACTAALSQPYTTAPHLAATSPIWSPEMLGPVVERACNANLQCALHAIGDQAVHNAINALERYGSRGQRHRIEHLELTSPADAARLGKLGITASIQPVHADPAIVRAWPKLLGPERLKRAFAYKEFADHGAVLALGSDAPTAPHPPIKNIYVATTRRSARQPAIGDAPLNEHFKLGLCEAVTAATQGAAYSSFDEGIVGALEVGKAADFVIMDMNFEPERLLDATVKETWFGGRKVFGL